MNVETIIGDEALRRVLFPVAAERVFLAHAGVAPLSRAAADALRDFAEAGSKDAQESSSLWEHLAYARRTMADLLACDADEVSLLGPTSLGLSLVANGLPWEEGDEVVCYTDDYPANVYAWTHLRERGVRIAALQPERPGVITWDVVERALTPRTKLVALASCHFLAGYRIDVDGIGRQLRERGILFCLDGIQTLGAFPLSVEHVDFLSADSHKWMLGPVGAGVFYVSKGRRELLKPTLLGSWNIVSPEFVAQEEMVFERGGRRYEPGTLNMPGILSMCASVELLMQIGIENVGRRILEVRDHAMERARALGFAPYVEEGAASDTRRSGILSLTHSSRNMAEVARTLADGGVSVSLRQDREGDTLLRLSPHFYNTEAEIDRVVSLLA